MGKRKEVPSNSQPESSQYLWGMEHEDLSLGPALRFGLLGGGQLGRMTIQAAQNLDLRVEVMDPDAGAPCARTAYRFTLGDLNNAQDVIAFGRGLDVLTVELENVSIEGLTALKAMGVRVLPDPEHLALICDKGVQKQFYADHGIPTSDFHLIEGRAETMTRALPSVQKLRVGGYDGRGVQVFRSEDDSRYGFDAPSVLEDAVDIEMELSVIVARSTSGEVATYPVVEAVFNDLNLVDYTVAPARISEEISARAQAIALDVVEKMNFVGLLAVELFLDREGVLLVNEVAPRSHNSGHHTIEANYTSQFEQHLRAVLGMPLGSTATRCAAAMLNLIGAEADGDQPGAEGVPVYKGLSSALAMEGVHPHIYGKALVRPGRKMGHVTALAPSGNPMCATSAVERIIGLKSTLSVQGS